jgi:hypothetical protein
MQTITTKIDGYDFGQPSVAESPVSMSALEELKQTVTLEEEDIRYLHMAGAVLENYTDEIVNVWRGVIGSTPHLVHYFKEANGRPDEHYKERAKERFKQWIIDLCFRPYDQDWLNYQHEIGLRHTHVKKNYTDDAHATPPHIPLRHVIAFSAVVINTVKPFLARGEHTPEEVEKMHQAWCKAVMLHVTLWSRAYVPEDDW